MPAISSMGVPQRAFEPLRLLVGLNDADLEALTAAIRADDVRSPSVLANRLVESLPDVLSPSLARELVGALFSLSALHFTHDWSVEDIVQSVAAYEPLGFAESEQERVLDLLGGLLNSRTVSSLAKAASIAVEHRRAFHTARIVSDIRPVFGDDPSSDPTGAVLSHTLRIDYHGSRSLESFFVTLDRQDLDLLAAVVDRARVKHDSLRRLLERADLGEFDASSD